MNGRRAWIGLGTGLALSCTVLVAPEVQAAPAWKARKDARVIAVEAKRLAAQGKYKKAAKRYRKADKLYGSPQYKLAAARAYAKAEDLLKALKWAEKAAKAPARTFADRTAIASAKKFAEDVDERIPTIEVTIEKPESASVTVTVDDSELSPGDGAVNFNPGSHEVVAEAPGHDRWTKTINLDEGDQEAVVIRMKKTGESDEDEGDSAGSGTWFAPMIVSWCVTAVGAGVGVGFGIAAISTTNQVLTDWGCDDGQCPAEAQDDLNAAKLNGNVSTGAFIGGGVALIAAGVFTGLYATSDDTPEDDAATAVKVMPLVGPGFVGLQGSF